MHGGLSAHERTNRTDYEPSSGERTTVRSEGGCSYFTAATVPDPLQSDLQVTRFENVSNAEQAAATNRAARGGDRAMRDSRSFCRVRFGRIAAQSRADRPTKCFPDASLRLLLAHAFEASRRLQLVRSYE